MVGAFSRWLNPSGQHLPCRTLLLSLEKMKHDHKVTEFSQGGEVSL